MSKKYKVVHETGRFLGHYPAHSPQEAVKKAVDACLPYYKEVADKNSSYLVTRGSEEWTV